MMIIDMTAQLAPMIWVLEAVLAMSVLAIVAPLAVRFLREQRGAPTAMGRRLAFSGGSSVSH